MRSIYNWGCQLMEKAYGVTGNVTLSRIVGNAAIVVYHTGDSCESGVTNKWVITARAVYQLLVARLFRGRAVIMYVYNPHNDNYIIAILPNKQGSGFRLRITLVEAYSNTAKPCYIFESAPTYYIAARLALGWAVGS